jgi:hypothetical protein
MKQIVVCPLSSLMILLMFATTGIPQDIENFQPYGKAFSKIFTNFHSELIANNIQSAFEVSRAYFGYRFSMSEYFSGIVEVDIGSPGDESPYSKLKRYAYFKNAGIRFKKGNIIWEFGLMDNRQFLLQEKYWGHRYIYKSFQDQHRFGVKADLGTCIEYKFNKWLTADITVMNGEGYYQLQLDNTFKTGIGISVYPTAYLLTRIYCDLTVKEETQNTIAAFLGYKKNKISIGMEYNFKSNAEFIRKYHSWGYSCYTSYQLNQKFELFGRFDRLSSKRIEHEEFGWNYNKDGSAIVAGIQYSPIKYLKIALNYQDWYPFPKNFENQTFIYLNMEFYF